MMLVKASAANKIEIYRTWKQLFSHDDGGSIDFFFEHYYDNCQTYLLKENNEIISGVCVYHYPIQLMNQVIEVSYLVGIFTKEAYQQQGYMRKLLHEVLEIESHQALMSVLMAYQPKVYQSFGFKPFVDHQIVNLSASMIPPVSTMNITYQVSGEQLLHAYNRFMHYFDGYKVRTKEDFEVLKLDMQAQQGKVVGYVEQQNLLGYMAYILHDQQIEILEIVYFDVDTLMRLLYFAANMSQSIKVHISTKEQWEQIFPKANFDIKSFLFARINDVELFNDCFNSSVFSVSDIKNLLSKPLFFNEYQ